MVVSAYAVLTGAPSQLSGSSFRLSSLRHHFLNRGIAVSLRYKAHEGRFLRVNFADETLRALFHTELSPSILGWVKACLRDGIDAAGARYVFLAFSSSQLREHGAWLYREPSSAELRSGLVRCFRTISI